MLGVAELGEGLAKARVGTRKSGDWQGRELALALAEIGAGRDSTSRDRSGLG